MSPRSISSGNGTPKTVKSEDSIAFIDSIAGRLRPANSASPPHFYRSAPRALELAMRFGEVSRVASTQIGP